MGKQRRSLRLPLSIPVRVYGRTPNERSFRDNTVTTMVSAHGAAFPLASRVKRGQTILLVNSFTDEEQSCRVIYTRSIRRGKTLVAVEFVGEPEFHRDFWHVYSALSMPLPKHPPTSESRSA